MLLISEDLKAELASVQLHHLHFHQWKLTPCHVSVRDTPAVLL